MAMNMIGEVQLPANRETVWAMLNEPAVLKSCIPGCESLDKDSDNEFRAVATIKIGPVKARWKGKVRFSNLDPPNSYRISGEGDGGVAGFAKGGAKVSLANKDGGTLLSYNVEAQIGGKLASSDSASSIAWQRRLPTISSEILPPLSGRRWDRIDEVAPMQAMHSRRFDDRRRRPCARRRWLRDPSGSRLFNQGG
jgi:carbon monoxide dehydrogenase subunit G